MLWGAWGPEGRRRPGAAGTRPGWGVGGVGGESRDGGAPWVVRLRGLGRVRVAFDYSSALVINVGVAPMPSVEAKCVSASTAGSYAAARDEASSVARW